VLNSWLKADSLIDIYLSESKVMYDTLVPLDRKAVAVIKQGNNTDTLINLGNGKFRTQKIRAKENTKYEIEVQTEGLASIRAQDSLPAKTSFRIINFIPEAKQNEWGDVYSETEMEINDPANEKNYYEIAAIDYSVHETFDENGDIVISEHTSFKYIRSKDIYVVNEGDNDYYPMTILLSDELFNGKTIRLKCNTYYQKGYNKELYILFRNISEISYKYKKKLLRHFENQYNDFWDGTGNPVQLFSNIENGYGVFAGYCEQRDTIIITDWQ
jgi:hypothetical protein